MKARIFILLLLPFSFLAQQAANSCREFKARKTQMLTKSASLTVAEIAKTELYDVSYYFLDLNMTNTSTYLSGSVEIHAKAKVNLDTALVELFESLTISQVQVNGNNVVYNRVANKINVPVNAAANSTFVLKITYAGNPPTAQTNPLGGSGLTAGTSNTWGNKVVDRKSVV